MNIDTMHGLDLSNRAVILSRNDTSIIFPMHTLEVHIWSNKFMSPHLVPSIFSPDKRSIVLQTLLITMEYAWLVFGERIY